MVPLIMCGQPLRGQLWGPGMLAEVRGGPSSQQLRLDLRNVLSTAVPGDAADTRVIWYTQPRAKPVFTDGLRVPAGYTESVLVTFPQW